MRKKIGAFVLAIVTALSCIALFAGCNGESEGFAGALSVQTYASAEDAVRGFLEEELKGDAVTVTYVDDTAGSTPLSEREIAALAISDGERQGLTAATRGTVSYREAFGGAEGGVISREVYVLEYGENYRYFAPAPRTGETLTASYLSWLVQTEKYTSCRMRTSGEEVVYGVNTKSESRNSYMLIAENALYLSDSARSMYLFEENGTYYSAVKGTGSEVWRAQALADGFEEMQAAAVGSAFAMFESSLYIKTENGFASRSGLLMREFSVYTQNETLSNALREGLADFRLEYTVQEGRIVNFAVSASFGDCSFQTHTTVEAMNGLSIEIPQEVRQAL